MLPVRRAVIDVGTNSIKLLVADVSSQAITPLLETSEQTRLGSGFYETHCLQSAAIQQTARVVASFAQMAQQRQAGSIRVIATSAARDAQNQHELVSAIQESSGLAVEIISGEQEAEWVFRGVWSDPKLRGQPLLILDVGGGSTELILGEHNHCLFRQSFRLGSVRLLEKFRPSDPPISTDLAGCREWLNEFLRREIAPALAPSLRHNADRVQLVGAGGTTTILARMFLETNDYDREQIEATRLTRQQVRNYVDHLWSLPLAQRRQIAGLPANRADVILMGAAIYEAVMEQFRFAGLLVTTRGLRFGAMMETA